MQLTSYSLPFLGLMNDHGLAEILTQPAQLDEARNIVASYRRERLPSDNEAIDGQLINVTLFRSTPLINKFNRISGSGFNLFDSRDEVTRNLQAFVRQLLYWLPVRRARHKGIVPVQCRGLGPRSIDRQNCPILVEQSDLLSQSIRNLLPHVDERGRVTWCNVRHHRTNWHRNIRVQSALTLW